MPMLDKTGPLGLGSKTGRRRGRCLDGHDSRRGFLLHRRCCQVLSVAAPLVITVVRELSKSPGLVRQIVSTLSSEKKDDTACNTVEDAEYTFIDHGSVSEISEEDCFEGQKTVTDYRKGT